jgi:ribosomal protein L24
MLLDPKDDKPTRVGMRTNDAGERERYSKRTGTAFE